MENCSYWQPESSRDPKQLQTVLDKLEAVRRELEPVCGTSPVQAQVIVPLELIAGACEILRFVDADVRNMIQRSEGYGEPQPPEAYLITCEPWP